MPVYGVVKSLIQLILLLAISVSAVAEIRHFSINNAQLSFDQTDQQYQLSANIDYPLTARVIEAIENGIPITFNQTIAISDPIPLIDWLLPWRQTEWSQTIQYQLRYHALSDQYILQSTDQQQRNYLTLEGALAEMGYLDTVILTIPTALHHKGEIAIKTEIDIEALPIPMQPGALISSKWQINSPWTPLSWPQ